MSRTGLITLGPLDEEDHVKTTRPAAIASAIAVVAICLTSVVSAPVPARAALDPASADHVNTLEQIGTEGGSIPASGWYRGAASIGSLQFWSTGIVALGETYVLNDVDAPADDLTLLLSDASFAAQNAAYFQVRLTLDVTGDGTEPTYLSPQPRGGDLTIRPDSLWASSAPFGTIPAGTYLPLSSYQAELVNIDATGDPSTDARITGYGFIGGQGVAGIVQAVSFAGETTYFTADPAGSALPTTLTLSQLRTSGLAVSASGFFPGEEVTVSLVPSGGASSTGTVLDVALTADLDGVVAAQVVVPASVVSAAGVYALRVVGDASSVTVSNDVTVTADPAGTSPSPGTGAAPVATPVRSAATFTG